jgi:hypothetical protein
MFSACDQMIGNQKPAVNWTFVKSELILAKAKKER